MPALLGAAAITVAALAVSLSAAPAHGAGDPVGPVDQLPSVVRGAHRAGALEGPEGTFPAIDAAIAAGSDVVDLDVRSLADGELAVSHDATVTRQSTSRASVARLSRSQWLGLRFDVAAWFGDVAGAAPVTLRQVLQRYAGRVALVVEIKTASSLPRAVDDVHATGAESSVILQSNDPAVVRRIHDAGLHADLWRRPAQLQTDPPSVWTGSGAEQLVVRSITPPELVDKAVASGLPVWVSGVNRRALASDVLARGARGVLSDAPAYTFRRTSARRVLPVAHWVSSLRLHRGTRGYVSGRVLLPALGEPVPGTRVAVTVHGVTVRTRSDAAGRFRVAVRAPRTVGRYRIGVSSGNLTVTQPGSEIMAWTVRGTARWDGVRPVLTVVR